MGPLPDHRVKIGAMFQSVAIDLFGPIEYQQHVKKRQVGKGWGVVFVCTTTSALNVEVMDTYSTYSFLMALRRFMGIRGTPTRFQSDRGEQLVAAAKQVSTWDFKEVIQWASKRGIEWTLVPTGGQHFNGQAERMIGLVKKQQWETFNGKKHSHEETVTLLLEAVQSINSRPITRNPRPEGKPLCVQDLMLGRAQPGQVEVKFERGKQLTRRFENVQRTKEEFWKRWIEEVFPEMLKQHKWTRDKNDVKVGDIVLRKDETAAGQTYKYARVTKVHVSSDGRVRAADVEYKLPREAVYRATTRPIHKLVMVLPVEEQAVASGLERGGVTRPEEPAPSSSEGAKVVEVEEKLPIENSHGSKPQPKERAQKRLTLAVKCKKVSSRKKVGEQTRTIVVTVPKGEEEMVDVRAVKRKRGRPRKTPGTEPLDPRKGSVRDPGKGVCADPVERAAILEVKGPGPPVGVSECQLSPDREGEKT